MIKSKIKRKQYLEEDWEEHLEQNHLEVYLISLNLMKGNLENLVQVFLQSQQLEDYSEQNQQEKLNFHKNLQPKLHLETQNPLLILLGLQLLQQDCLLSLQQKVVLLQSLLEKPPKLLQNHLEKPLKLLQSLLEKPL